MKPTARLFGGLKGVRPRAGFFAPLRDPTSSNDAAAGDYTNNDEAGDGNRTEEPTARSNNPQGRSRTTTTTTSTSGHASKIPSHNGRSTTHYDLLYGQLWKKRPSLQRRCELLRLKYPREDLTIKVRVPGMLHYKIYRFSPHMKVADALCKIKERKRIVDMPQKLLALYVPAKDDDSDGVWMEPTCPLWMYNLSYRQTVEIRVQPRREDPVSRHVFLRFLIADGKGSTINRTFGFDPRTTVSHVLEEVNRRVAPTDPSGNMSSSRSHYGLYLYNNTSGMWLEESKPLSFYNISHMDILGFMEKSLFHFRLDGSSETSSNTLLLPCDAPVDVATLQILSWFGGVQATSSAEQQTNYCEVQQRYALWIEGRGGFAANGTTLAAYGLEEGDVLVLQECAAGEHFTARCRLKLIKVDPPPIEHSSEVKEPNQDTSRFKEFASYRLFPRLEGEVIILITGNASWVPPYMKNGLGSNNFEETAGGSAEGDSAAAAAEGYMGDLYITNYRLALFVPTFSWATSEEDTFLPLSVPLACISRVDVGKQKDRFYANRYYLEIACKDLRNVRILFTKGDKPKRNNVYSNLIEGGLLFPSSTERLFAFFYKPSYVRDEVSEEPSSATVAPGDQLNETIESELTTCQGAKFEESMEPGACDWKHQGWDIFSMQSEFERQGIPNSKWQLISMNKDYTYCESYPSLLAVPTGVSEDELKEVFAFRSKGRIPVICYRHSNNIIIARCSQPLAGLTRTRSVADEKLFRLLLDNSVGSLSSGSLNGSAAERQRHSPRLMYILDARPRANAYANAAKGGGIENLQGYPNCKFEYLGIPNIHVIRDSLTKLHSVCVMGAGQCEGGFFSALDATKWLDYIKLILEGACKVARLVEQDRCPVTLHCSDGWDRTAQLSSLAQIFLDPFFRTLCGFQILIEKEWMSFGHKFATRCGHGDKNHQDSQRSPIFLQLTNQYPCMFEYNDRFLITILEHLYSCRFGTFLYDTEKQRIHQRVKEKTVSLWSYTNCTRNRHDFINPFYVPDMSILIPDVTYTSLALWKSYYMRHLLPPSAPRLTPQLRLLQLQNVIEGMKEQMVRLENYCHEHRRRNRDRKQLLEYRRNDHNGEEVENRRQQQGSASDDPSSVTASRDRHSCEATQQQQPCKKGNRLREHYDEDDYEDDDGYEEGREAEDLARLLEETHTPHIMTLIGPSASVVGGS